jgi:hypothetical protein
MIAVFLFVLLHTPKKKGELQCANGNVYIGQFNKKNEFHGIGLYQYKLRSDQKLSLSSSDARQEALIELWKKHRQSQDEKSAKELDSYLSEHNLNDVFFSPSFVGYFGEPALFV